MKTLFLRHFKIESNLCYGGVFQGGGGGVTSNNCNCMSCSSSSCSTCCCGELQVNVSSDGASPAVLTADILSGAAPFTYQWYEDDVLKDGETDASITTSAGSSYYVIVRDKCNNAVVSNAIAIPAE